MRVPLLIGAYQARSIIADAQRCINLYPEENPKDSPVPVTHYPTAGLTQLAQQGAVGGNPVRCSYTASNGDLYAVIGNSVCYVSPLWAVSVLGTIGNGTNPVSISDNGLFAMIVDGTVNGYSINLSTRVFAAITDPSFYGADKVDYIDTYFVLNRPGTNQFYYSPSNWIPGVLFNPLNIASKTGAPDPLQTLIVMHREIWLIGTMTTEVWYDAGAPDSAFQILPGVFVEHGCMAKYSVAKIGLIIFWLSQDARGKTIILQGSNYAAERVSTHALEAEFATYSTISDAVGYSFQYGGHVFYALVFPTANKTWCYDQTTKQWHQLAWLDADGNLNRHRSNCAAFAYNANVMGDWDKGMLYALDPSVYTDNGNPVTRIRSFPHGIDNDKNARILYKQFIADMDVGEDPNSTPDNPPMVALRWSDTRGASWGNAIRQSMGAGGQYETNIQWQRLGLGRDRVFELSWSAPVKTALNGAFIESEMAET